MQQRTRNTQAVEVAGTQSMDINLDFTTLPEVLQHVYHCQTT